jgi:anthranilate phosphoribosyltransferase
MAPVMAAVLAERGDTAIVFRGDDGLDELTTTTTSSAWVAADGEVVAATVDPDALGIAAVAPEELRGGDAAFNATVVRDVLGGGGGGVRDTVLLNAAAGIAAYDGLAGARLHDALARGMQIAAESIDSGAAAALLDRWVTVSQAARTATLT